MKKRNLSKNKPSQKIHREKDPIPWRYCLVTLVCGVALVGGFFLAARSHFASIDFAIKNSDLKKQLEDLEAEKRRLIYLKETALSPAEIKKAAKKLGLTEIRASNFVSSGNLVAEEKAVKNPSVKKNDEKPQTLVEKTVDVKPVEKNGKDGSVKTTAVAATPVKKEAKEKLPTQIAKK